MTTQSAPPPPPSPSSGSTTQTGSVGLAPRFTRWLLFSVIFAFLPIIFSAILTLSEGEPFSYGRLVGKGELLLISAAFSASAIGELFIPSLRFHLLRTSLAGSNLLVAVGASAWFTGIQTAQDNHHLNVAFVSIGSTVLLIFSILSSGCSVLFSGHEVN